MSENGDLSYAVREVVGVFGNRDKLEAAVETLEAAGFRREAISVMASREAVVENLNHRFESIESTEDGPQAPRAAFNDDLAAGNAAVVRIPLYIGATVGSLVVVASGGAPA